MLTLGEDICINEPKLFILNIFLKCKMLSLGENICINEPKKEDRSFGSIFSQGPAIM